MEQEQKPVLRELSRDELREVTGGGGGLIDRDTLEGEMGDLGEAIGLGQKVVAAP